MLKRTQVYLDEDILEVFRLRAKEDGVSLAELLRQLMNKEVKKKKKYADLGRKYLKHPLDGIIGLGNSGDPNASINHDEIYFRD